MDRDDADAVRTARGRPLRGGDEEGSDDVHSDLLLRNIAMEPDPEIEAAWLEEVRRRIRESGEGRVKAIPGEEVVAKARERVEGPVREELKTDLGLE